MRKTLLAALLVSVGMVAAAADKPVYLSGQDRCGDSR